MTRTPPSGTSTPAPSNSISGRRAPRLDEPDHVILDLDANRDVDFGTILNAGALVHDALVELNLRGFPKTSGAGGLHVYLPLSAEYAFADVRGWVDAFSRRLARRFPETFAIAKRGSHASDRVTIDSAQNSIGRNTAAPYTVRARPGAPVSAPLTWVEVHDGRVKPTDFNLRSMPQRFALLGDLFAPVLHHDQRLTLLGD